MALGLGLGLTQRGGVGGASAPYEFITNGGFDTEAPWLLDAGWSIGSGVASNSGTAGNLYQNFNEGQGALTSGRDYTFSFNLTNDEAGLIIVRLRGIAFPGTTQTLYTDTGAGLISVPFTANANRSQLLINSPDGLPFSVDNVSILGPPP